MCISSCTEYIFYIVTKLFFVFWYLPMVMIGMCRKKRVCAPSTDLPVVMQMPGVELARRIANKEVTSRFVVEAFIARMKEVNPIVNAIVVDRFEEALKEADLVDERLQSTEKTGSVWLEEFPLLGVPITMKESIGVAGMSNTAGYALAAERRAVTDADVVVSCKKAGAIILALTNTPELCLNLETYNSRTGTTRNPYNTKMTSGGSSGGECALLGAGASVIGFGSDTAGSLRIPAHCCGVFGHKPTAHVVSTIGHFVIGKNLEWWHSFSTIGPICRYACDLLPMLRIIARDDLRASLNLSQKVDIAKLKIYVLKNYGSILCSNLDSEISDGIDLLLDHFKVKHMTKVERLRKTFFKNTMFPAVQSMLQIRGIEFEHPKDVCWGLVKTFFHCSNVSLNTYLYSLIEKYGETVTESTFTKVNTKLDTLRNELETLLGEDGVLMMPAFYRTANYHYTTNPKCFDAANTTIFNVLGLPATCCPIGWHTNGLPFGIQVISKRFNDRLSLAVAEEIEKMCGGWKMPQKQM